MYVLDLTDLPMAFGLKRSNPMEHTAGVKTFPTTWSTRDTRQVHILTENFVPFRKKKDDTNCGNTRHCNCTV